MIIDLKNVTLKSLEVWEIENLLKKEIKASRKAFYQKKIDMINKKPLYILYSTFWIILLNNKPIGNIFFNGIEIDGGLEIRFSIEDEYQNKGYATEAVKGIVEMAFKNIHVHYIYGICKPNEIAASRVLAKNHFKIYEELKDGTVFQYGR